MQASALPAAVAVNITALPNGCWNWTGRRIWNGYGRFKVVTPGSPTQDVYAHRMTYELTKGEIPSGLQLDHTCHKAEECAGGVECPHRRCVNPDHLEPVTYIENYRRGNSFCARNSRRTHCIAGHPFNEQNTKVDGKGFRSCRVCDNRRNREYRARRREQIAADAAKRAKNG